ncbi:MAG: hypothetical protein Q9163_001939 [Psora crenata]
MHSNGLEAFLSSKFTHIVVGGGTAGLVVASRLSEHHDIRVGVLEAGTTTYDDPRITVPGRLGETLGSEYDWQFETTKQPGLGGRSLPFPRGKVLGGTSALNFMTWNRGCREDYDAWEKLGNEGWGWDGLMPYFKKSENFQEPTTDHQKEHQSHYDPAYHGKGGPVQITFSATYGASHKHWHATMHKLGIKTNCSHFSGSNVGCWTNVTGVTPDLRERSYSATAYYRPVCNRGNLVLLTEAVAQEVLMEQEGSEWVVKGVRFTHGGLDHTVKVSGEVIVCGGSVSSPQLLELSGIGNPKILEAAGIACKVDNANVGENLQEHIMTAMIFEIDPSIVTPEDLRADPVLAAAADKQYALEHSGPRTAIPSSMAYLPFAHFIPADELQRWGQALLAQSPDNCKLRDRILVERLTTDCNLGQIEYLFDVSNYNPYFQGQPGKKYGTMLMMYQYPFSKGYVHIPASASSSGKEGEEAGVRVRAEDKPVIDPKYYQGPDGGDLDFQLMVRCQSFADKICRTPPLSSIIVERVFPPAASLDADPTTYNFTEWVRDTTITDWHPIGTCAMGGHEGIRGGVVDDRLRVYGVRGLRVCDASVMPLQIAAHLQATVYAIGEKGANLLVEDWIASGKGAPGREEGEEVERLVNGHGTGRGD